MTTTTKTTTKRRRFSLPFTVAISLLAIGVAGIGNSLSGADAFSLPVTQQSSPSPQQLLLSKRTETAFFRRHSRPRLCRFMAGTTEPPTNDESGIVGIVDRRTAISTTTAATTATTTLAIALVGLAFGPQKALALKQKNEALCGTGFFEHIYEYKCTAIGDIEDEGYSKALSQAETGLTDGLMGKLGVVVDGNGDVSGDSDDETTSKKKKTSARNENGVSQEH